LREACREEVYDINKELDHQVRLGLDSPQSGVLSRFGSGFMSGASQRTLGTGRAMSAEDRNRLKKRVQQLEACSKNLAYNHVVMVFVPPRDLVEMKMRNQEHWTEYKRKWEIQFGDPSNWQPLDPIRTFNHYRGMYGFGGNPEEPQHLHVVEGTEDYKNKNSRYRHYAAEEKRWRLRIHHIDMSTTCYGFAKYLHKHDGNSEEWRPVLAEALPAAADSSAEKRDFLVNYLHVPTRTGDIAGGLKKPLVSEDSLLFAPLAAKLLGSGVMAHQEYLKLAKGLEQQGHKPDKIRQLLNERLMDKWQAAVEGRDVHEAPPVPISLREVKHALNS